MLYLTRKINESIVLNSSITISIVEINNGVVRLGITSPQGTSILRKEMYTSISDENMEAISCQKEFTERKIVDSED